MISAVMAPPFESGAQARGKSSLRSPMVLHLSASRAEECLIAAYACESNAREKILQQVTRISDARCGIASTKDPEIASLSQPTLAAARAEIVKSRLDPIAAGATN